jgi:hypothetical protein
LYENIMAGEFSSLRVVTIEPYGESDDSRYSALHQLLVAGGVQIEGRLATGQEVREALAVHKASDGTDGMLAAANLFTVADRLGNEAHIAHPGAEGNGVLVEFRQRRIAFPLRNVVEEIDWPAEDEDAPHAVAIGSCLYFPTSCSSYNEAIDGFNLQDPSAEGASDELRDMLAWAVEMLPESRLAT